MVLHFVFGLDKRINSCSLLGDANRLAGLSREPVCVRLFTGWPCKSVARSAVLISRAPLSRVLSCSLIGAGRSSRRSLPAETSLFCAFLSLSFSDSLAPLSRDRCSLARLTLTVGFSSRAVSVRLCWAKRGASRALFSARVSPDVLSRLCVDPVAAISDLSLSPQFCHAAWLRYLDIASIDRSLDSSVSVARALPIIAMSSTGVVDFHLFSLSSLL